MKRYINISYVPVLFILVFILRYSNYVSVLVCNLFYLATLPLGCLFFIVSKRKADLYVLLYGILVIVFGFITGLHTGEFNVSLYIKTLCYIFLARFLLVEKLPFRSVKVIYYIMAVSFILLLLQSSIDANEYWQGLSRNYFSILLMAMLILYYISWLEEKKEQKIPVLPSILLCAVSILAVGRAGILTSAMLFVGVLYLNWFVVSKNKKRKIILVLLAVLVIIGVLIKGIPASLLSSVFSRFISMGMKSEGRMELWVTYLHLCTDSIENLFFGSPIYGNDIFGRLDYNLHNSFLQMHNTYGLSLLTIFIIGTVVSLKNSYKRKQYLIVLLGITFFIRACLDQMGFAFFTEIYFYYFLFYSSFKYMMSEEKGGK